MTTTKLFALPLVALALLAGPAKASEEYMTAQDAAELSLHLDWHRCVVRSTDASMKKIKDGAFGLGSSFKGHLAEGWAWNEAMDACEHRVTSDTSLRVLADRYQNLEKMYIHRKGMILSARAYVADRVITWARTQTPQ